LFINYVTQIGEVIQCIRVRVKMYFVGAGGGQKASETVLSTLWMAFKAGSPLV
jgi:hypothetical protein